MHSDSMTFEFRFGGEADIPLIADMVIAAGDGLFESLLDDLVPGVGVRQFVRMAVGSEDSPLGYANAVLAEQNDTIVGMALCYPSDQYGLHPLLKNLIPNRRIDPLRPLFASKVENSFYLNTLVVSERIRGKGLGRMLVEFCKDWSVEEGCDSLSLHVWADNTSALSFYHRLGFEAVMPVPVTLRTQPERSAGMLLLSTAVSSPQ